MTSVPPLRVLCVDDNRDAAMLLAELLRLTGYEARCGFDGADGLAVARRFRPDACVADLDMPVMTGDELARRLRAEYGAEMLLVAMTGVAGPDGAARAAAAGFDWVLVKPAPAAELLRVVSAYDARRAASLTPAPTKA